MGRLLGKLRKTLDQHNFEGKALPEKNSTETGCYVQKSTRYLIDFVDTMGEDNEQLFLLRFPPARALFPKKFLFPAVPVFDIDLPKTHPNTVKTKMYTNLIFQHVFNLFPMIDRVVGKISKCIKPYNRSPFLLPVENYRDKVVKEYLEKFYNFDELSLLTVPNSLFDQLDSNIKKEKSGRSKLRRFKDSRRVIFQTSAAADHGDAWSDEELSQQCIDNNCRFYGRIRLGTTFPVGFHFDCTNAGKTSCEGDFENCHGDQGHYRSRKNLNIYPNDYIRNERKLKKN